MRNPAYALCLLLFLCSGGALGSPPGSEGGVSGSGAFVPADLYRYETVTLGNGFKAVLNPRGGSRNVSFRLVVDVGLLDFDCRDRELPHLAEHLLFSGFDDLTETDLDALIGALGGEWNAYTHPWKTEYQLDIYSGHALEGLEVLFRMFTETELSAEGLAAARGVVHAESGGRPGLVRNYLYRWGFGEGAVDDSYRRFVPSSRTFCSQLPVTDHIALADIDDFLRTRYQPDAMLLIAVGDFDPARLTAALESTWGTIAPRDLPRPIRRQAALEPRAIDYRTRLNPVFGNTTEVTVDLFVASPEPLSGEYFALEQLAGWLDSRLYEEVRVNRGLAYTPTASLVDQGDFMTVLLDAEIDPARADEVLGIMVDLIGELRRDGIDADTLATQRQGHLYRLAAQLDSNTSFSGIYVEASEGLARGEPLPDIETALGAYDAKALRTFAAEQLAMDRALVFRAAPTVTYRAAGWMLAVISAVFGFVLWRVLVRRRARSRHRAD
jgi:predicted Zn-dependent peptidase